MFFWNNRELIKYRATAELRILREEFGVKKEGKGILYFSILF
jgi:hypothetical protein